MTSLDALLSARPADRAAVASGGKLGNVAERAAVARQPLAGRVAAVVGLLKAAAHHDGSGLLVSGEAGVGKTALVREASAYGGEVADVLWAPCLPLTSLAVPFLPLASALRVWAADRDVSVPALGGSARDGPAEYDAWLDELCRQKPALLVVDDLHWADQSSLDVLMYVLAGLAGRRWRSSRRSVRASGVPRAQKCRTQPGS